MTKLSVVISAFNEEAKIQDCLNSVSFADEIVLVDNFSTDQTVKIAQKYTKKIYKTKNNPMLNINKNFGFTKATNDWILSLDADERITPELAREIEITISKNDSIVGYWIPRRNIIFGKWIQNSIWWPDYQLRLFKKGSGEFPEVHVHEMIKVDGETKKLEEPMEHQNYDSISQYIYKLDRIYTENEADIFLRSGREIAWYDAIRFPVQDFLKTFFAKNGYRDGLHGLVLSLLQAFYAEIVFAKIWEKQGFKQHSNKNFLTEVYKESKNSANEINYWFLTSFINENSNSPKKYIFKIFRKFTSSKLQ